MLTDKSRCWPPAADNIIKEWRHLHLKQQHRERLDAGRHELLAKTDTELGTAFPKYFYMCADFVSNSVADTPHFVIAGRHYKLDQSKNHIQTRMCGVHVICGEIDELFTTPTI